MSYTKLIYHIIFSTYKREMTIDMQNERAMYRAIFNTIISQDGYVHRIGGMPDHIHICVQLPANKCLANVVKEIKRQTSLQFKDRKTFKQWNGWEEGYGAFTCDAKSMKGVVEYIMNQKAHHTRESFADEYRRWLDAYGYQPRPN